MEQHDWETDSHSASQNLSRALLNRKFIYVLTEPVTQPCHESVESIPQPHTPFLYDLFFNLWLLKNKSWKFYVRLRIILLQFLCDVLLSVLVYVS